MRTFLLARNYLNKLYKESCGNNQNKFLHICRNLFWIMVE